jgi:hypothetical protein
MLNLDVGVDGTRPAMTPVPGLRIGDTVALDMTDVRMSARKGVLVVYCKAGKIRRGGRVAGQESGRDPLSARTGSYSRWPLTCGREVQRSTCAANNPDRLPPSTIACLPTFLGSQILRVHVLSV